MYLKDLDGDKLLSGFWLSIRSAEVLCGYKLKDCIDNELLWVYIHFVL